MTTASLRNTRYLPKTKIGFERQDGHRTTHLVETSKNKRTKNPFKILFTQIKEEHAEAKEEKKYLKKHFAKLEQYRLFKAELKKTKYPDTCAEQVKNRKDFQKLIKDLEQDKIAFKLWYGKPSQNIPGLTPLEILSLKLDVINEKPIKIFSGEWCNARASAFQKLQALGQDNPYQEAYQALKKNFAKLEQYRLFKAELKKTKYSDTWAEQVKNRKDFQKLIKDLERDKIAFKLWYGKPSQNIPGLTPLEILSLKLDVIDEEPIKNFSGECYNARVSAFQKLQALGQDNPYQETWQDRNKHFNKTEQSVGHEVKEENQQIDFESFGGIQQDIQATDNTDDALFIEDSDEVGMVVQHHPFKQYEKTLQLDLSPDHIPMPGEILAKNHKEIALGDMHANPTLFIHSLVQTGFFKIKDQEAFAGLMQIANQDEPYTLETFGTFRQLLTKSLELREDAEDTQLVLIGDLLGDRGPNDGLILEILDFLNEQPLNFFIPFSNHDMEFCNYYYSSELSGLGADQARSTYALHHTLENTQGKDQAKDWLDARFKTYKKHLTLAVLSEQEGAYYGHGCLTDKLVEKLCTQAEISSSESPLKDINRWFKWTVFLNAKNYQEHSVFHGYKKERNIWLSAAVWGRGGTAGKGYEHVFEGDNDLTLPKGMTFCIHGHTEDIGHPNYLSIDGSVGKPGKNIGERKIFAVPKT